MSRGRHSSHSRLLCLLLSLSGTITNSVIAYSIVSLAGSLRWEVVESEWESSYASWTLGIDSMKLIWAILSFYFVICSLICGVGVIGVWKRNLSFVKLYRDYSLINLSVSAFSTIFFALASFRVSVRTSICEELTRHPELLPDLAEAGLDIENCEPWLEKASLATVAVMAVLLVVRLQFTLAVTSYTAQLARHSNREYLPLEDGTLSESQRGPSAPRRIFLLPNRTNSAPQGSGPDNDVVVYAPVPLSSLSPQETHDLDAAEAWFTSGNASRRRQGSISKSPQSPTHHGRSHSGHHRRHSSSLRIKLPVSPDEPLLPEYETLVLSPDKREV